MREILNVRSPGGHHAYMYSNWWTTCPVHSSVPAKNKIETTRINRQMRGDGAGPRRIGPDSLTLIYFSQPFELADSEV